MMKPLCLNDEKLRLESLVSDGGLHSGMMIAQYTAAYTTVRAEVPHLAKDRILSRDIRKVIELTRSGRLVAVVENISGVLY